MNKIKIHKDICELLHDTYKIKNSDYGNSFSKVREEYDEAIIIRLKDKLERLKMLYKKEYTAKVNESIDDTLLDLANYAIMELLEREVERQALDRAEEFLDEINICSENNGSNKNKNCKRGEVMNLNEYQKQSQRTARKEVNLKDRLIIAGLGIAGEAGEVSDIIKKYIGHGHDLNVDEIKKELGDVLWYIAEISEVIGFTLEEVAEENIEKLKKRYPAGFETERSINCR